MNDLHTLAFLDALGFNVLRVLISLVWQSSLLIVIAAIMAGILRRRSASMRHSVWASLLCLIPLIPLLVWVASLVGTPQVELPLIPEYSATVSDNSLPASSLTQSITRTDATQPFRLTDYPWALWLFVYSAGVLFFLTALAVSRVRIRRWKKQGAPVTDSRMLNVFRAMSNRLGLSRPVAVIESGAITAPLTIGAIHPVIMLPRGFTRDLSEPELRSLAVHELFHVRRYDSLIFTVVAVVRAVLFFNPLLWFAAREVAVLAESACDDAVVEVVNEPVAYAKMLTRLVVALPKRLFTTELAAGFSISKHSFLRRVEMILIERKDRFRRLSGIAKAGIVAALIVSFIMVIMVPLGCGDYFEKRSERLAIRRFFSYVHSVKPGDSGKMVTIRGTVIDPDGNPVSGAMIDAAMTSTYNSLTGDSRYSVLTDDTGKYEIKVPSNGDFKFNLVAHDGEVLEFRNWANGFTELLVTKPGQIIDNLTIRLNPLCTVSGTVRDKNGHPMADHHVLAHPVDPRCIPMFDPWVKTDDQGRYIARGICPGTNIITSTGMLPLNEGDIPEGFGKRFTIAPGETRENIDLVGIPDKELLAWLRKHTPLKYKINRFIIECDDLITYTIKSIF